MMMVMDSVRFPAGARSANLVEDHPLGGDTDVTNASKALISAAATPSGVQDGIYCPVLPDGYRGREYLPNRPGTCPFKHRVYSVSIPMRIQSIIRVTLRRAQKVSLDPILKQER